MLDKNNKMLDIIKWRSRNTNKYKKILFVLGIVICLVGAEPIFDGAILGKTTTNIATILGMTGIGLITTQRKTMNNGGE